MSKSLTFRHAAVAALVCLGTSTVMLSPFMNLAHLGTALHVGDGRTQAWVLAWVAHALTTGASIFDANMFYPTHESLAHTDHMVALGLLATPLWVATSNAILVFNVLQLCGPALTSFAGFLLFRRWTGDGLASLAGGLVFGLSFFTLLHNAHLNLTWAAGLPLSLLLLERWWAQPTWARLAGLWIVAALTALTSWYLAVLLALAVVLYTVVLATLTRRVDLATRAPQVIAAAALGGAVLLPFLAPYLGRGSEAGEAVGLAADIRSYLVPPEHTIVGRALVARGMARAQTIWGERTLFLGWLTLSIAVLGLLETVRSEAREQRFRGWFLIGLIVIGAALSFGPSQSGLAPFDLLARLPGLGGFRSTARFALLVVLATAALVAFGLTRIRRIAPGAAPVLLVGLLALMMTERFVVDFPSGHPQPEAMPDIYALARADGARAAIALPIYAGLPSWFYEGDYLLYSTSAEFLPLANGIGRWVPSEYLALGEAMRTFPSSSSAAALRFYGITHVIFHGSRFGEAESGLLAQISRSTDYAIVTTRGSDVLPRVAVP